MTRAKGPRFAVRTLFSTRAPLLSPLDAQAIALPPEILPSSEVSYTDSVDSSGLVVVTPGTRHVEFGYTKDPSRGDLFYRGLKVQSEQVLSSIRTKVNDVAVRTYWLTTVPVPSADLVSLTQDFLGGDFLGRDVLSDVTECPGDGSYRAACRPATQFNWSTRPFDGSFAPDDELDGTLSTTTHVPTVKEDEHYAWLLADVTGDGLADIVEAKAGPGKTVVWSVIPNLGGVFGPPSPWTEFAFPPGFGQGTGEWTLGVLDYDDDGVADILLDYEGPRAAGAWTTLQVLLSRPAGATPHFILTDTAIPRAQARGDTSVFPHYDPASVSAWMLADLNGDGKADLVQCEDRTTEPESGSYVANDCLDHPPCLPAASRWSIAYWTPTGGASGGAGFEASPSVELPSLATLSCWTMASYVTALDADGNGVTDLLFPDPATERFQRIEIDIPSNTAEQHPLGETVGAGQADPVVLGKTSPRFWHETPDHNVALSPVKKARYLFPDLNGDGIADVVFFAEQGPGHYTGPVTQYLTGDGAAVDAGVLENEETSSGAHAFDLYAYARVLDYNGDGRDDLLVPEAVACDPGPYCVRYVVWQSAKLGKRSRRVVLDIAPPNASDLAEAYALPLSSYKKRLQMRITDLDADGTPDLVFPGGGGGPLKTYTNRGKLDYLTEITTGENPLTPPAVLFCPNAPTGRCAGGDPDFHPDIAITYGPLTSPAFDPDASLYAAHVDAKNPCVYPRGCLVSQEPVVSGYKITSGDNQRRSFSLRYRDGRFDRRGHGFLGFGTVVRRDDDTGRTSIETFDNVTYDPAIRAYPYAGMMVRRAGFVRAASTDADPSRVDMTFAESEPAVIQTWGSATYYVTSAAHTETARVGHWSASAGQGRLEDYVLDPNHAAVTVRKAHRTAQNFDAFGHARTTAQWTEGLSELTATESTTSDDASLWLMGKLEARTVCSTALGRTQCQTIEYDYDPTTGLVVEARRAPELPSAYLKIHLDRDAQGNVWHRTDEDKQGHLRESWIGYEPEGVFPASLTNALGQVVTLQFDPASGQKLVETDLNGHVRKWRYDTFGLLTEIHAIDGNVTVVGTKRQKSGVVGADFWQTQITVSTPGYGIDREVQDSVGRVVQRARRGPNVPMRGADGQLHPPLSWLVQEQRYTPLGQLAYRSVRHIEGDTSAAFGTAYRYDGAGRPVDVEAPNGATAHDDYGYFPGGSSVDETTTQALDAAVPPKTTTILDAEGRVTEVHDAAGGTVRYAFGPFARLAVVTGADLTSTGIDHDPYGRVVHQRDPDKGDSSSEYDGFDELLQTTDALGRTTSYKVDELGRVYERSGANGFTRYTYDQRPHGKGLLGRVEELLQGTSRDFYFDAFSRLTSMELSLDGGTIVAEAERQFDRFGRVRVLDYPTQPGMESFSVLYAYDDTSGELVAVTDREDQAYWRLLTVDEQGNAIEEQYGAQTARVRRFDPATGALLSIRTTSGSKTLQDWSYAYDKRGNPIARYDLRQEDASKTSEFFHFDALDRLTCSTFTACRPGDLRCYGSAPPSPGSCDQSLTYDPNGNITSKSDVGGYVYNPAHPHAVQSITGVGAATYGHDAVGNQTERPGVIGTITYNSFDLPTKYTTAAGTTALTYDDAGQRIRKVDPAQETLYFGEIYERVTTSKGVEDRYYLSNTEGVFAVASRSAIEQKTPEVRYVFTDNLGSTDVITDETGSVEQERQSYDSFGARRNVAWGKPMPPPSGPAETTAMGYTGHALDAEVGLVDAKGRLYDPKLGRFLQVDPLQTDLFNAQRWNSYSYGLNNPLRYTDPTGFDGKEEGAPALPGALLEPVLDANGNIDPTHGMEWHCAGDGKSCTGTIVPIKPGGGDLGTAQAGSPAEEASAPAAPGALEIGAAYVEGLAPSLGSAVLGGVQQSARMLLLPLIAPWEMIYGNVQRAQSLARAYEHNGWSGVFWTTVDGLPVLGAVTAAVDAYREAYALPITEPLDRARAAGQVTVPMAVAAVGVVGAAVGLAEGAGAVAGAGAARGGAGTGQLLKNAVQPFNEGRLTQAGRALTKHPEVIGQTKATLRSILRTEAEINAAAEGALGGILRSGTPTVRDLGRFGPVLEYRAPSGFGARFSTESGEFIGFITPP